MANGQPVGSLFSDIARGFYGALDEHRGRVREDEARQQQLEGDILQTLATTPGINPEVQAAAFTGLINLAKPRSKAKGLRGFLGETTGDPVFQSVMNLIGSPEQVQISKPNVEAFPATPPFQGAAAQPSQAVTEHPQAPQDVAAQIAAGKPPTPQLTPISESLGQPPPVPRTTETVERPRRLYVDTPEERFVEGLMRQIMLANPQLPENEARQQALHLATARFGSALFRTGSRGTQAGRFGGEVRGDQLPEGTMDANGNPVDPAGIYRRMIQPDNTELLFPITPDIRSAGAGLEGTAQSLGFASYADAVQRMGQAFGDQLVTLESQRNAARAGDQTAAVQAVMTEYDLKRQLQAPIGLDQGARQGLPGTTALGATSGVVPVSQEQRERLDAAQGVMPDLQRIMDLVPLVFPASNDPIATNISLLKQRWQRDPNYARLQAELNTVVGNIARVRAAEAGRLTQPDIERAYTALANIQTSLLNGDTRESALARLTETQRAMQRVIDQIRLPGAQMGVGTPPPSANPDVFNESQLTPLQ